MACALHIEVQVECADTKFGEYVGVVGSHDALGNWDTNKAVQLDGASFPVWKGRVNLDTKSSVEYKYVILRKGGGADWEQFDGNRCRLVGERDALWQDGRFGEKGMADNCLFEKPTIASSPRAAPAPEASNVSTVGPTIPPACSLKPCLIAHCAKTSVGDHLAVVGSWDWDAEPLKMDGSGFPTWRGTLNAAPGQNLEYKYLILRSNGSKLWEARQGNRTLDTSKLEHDDGQLTFEEARRNNGSGHRFTPGDRKARELDPVGCVQIVAPDRTNHGKVRLDYGTLEQRMAKRMDQPTTLQGDHDESCINRGRSGPKAGLDTNASSLHNALKSRTASWPHEEDSALAVPPATSPQVDNASAFNEILQFECRGAVTLAERFGVAKNMLEDCKEGSALPWTVFVWLRYSQARQLTWQRRSNTKPMHLSNAARELSELISKRYTERPKEQRIWRLLLACVPRGSSGDDGQAIRDYILTIMQKFQLKKRKGDFMEQWHQKLHNNTTPDDIYICEAYLLFLYSDGDLGTFYGHLADHQITRERLQTFERPILQEPVFFPSIKNGLINEFETYLQILKNVHACADLEKCIDATSERLDGGVRAQLETILAERAASGGHALHVLACVASVRAAAPVRIVASRDQLYLDLALEAHSRLLAERLGDGELGLLEAGLATAFVLEGLCRSFGGSELRAALRDFVPSLAFECQYSLLRAAAAAERVRGALAAVADVFTALQDRADRLGSELRAKTPEELPEKWAVTLFAEEAARGGPGFAVSLLLTAYECRLRKAMGGGAWQLVSLTDARIGELHILKQIRGDETLATPSVVLVDKIGGEEDPPEGTVALLTPDAVDVLSHLAVRARTMGVFLATCFDVAALESVRALQGCHVRVKAKAGAVIVEKVAIDELNGATDTSMGGPSNKRVEVKMLAPSKELWLSEDAISSCKATGAKSQNLVALRKALASWIKLPRSAVVPHGVLARVLEAVENQEIHAKLKVLIAELAQCSEMAHAEPLLHKIRDLIKSLRPPAVMRSTLQQAVELHGGVVGDMSWWQALVAVWASSWGNRAFQACRRASIQPGMVAMAVLVQQLVRAEYSFVIHTRNPTGDPCELYAEVVVGLGEVLVGNYAGRALGFVAPRDGSSQPRVITLPSKGVALATSGLIFRSDSNTEDLEDFAGAGLFDSVPVSETTCRVVEYHCERLVNDLSFQSELLSGIAKLAIAVEVAAGGKPQDIEGCYFNGDFFVVQTRPQA